MPVQVGVSTFQSQSSFFTKRNLPEYMSYRRDLAREAKVARQKDVLQQAEHIADQE